MVLKTMKINHTNKTKLDLENGTMYTILILIDLIY